MRSLKKWLAAVLTAGMVMTNILPSFAEPAWEMPEVSEDIFTAETGEITEVEEVAEVSVTDEDYNEATPSDAQQEKLLGDSSDRVTVTYVDETAEIKSAECIPLSGTAADSFNFAAGEWYVVQGTFVAAGRIVTNAPEGNPAHLILDSNCKLEARKGIEIAAGKELIIYVHDLSANDTSILTTYYENESGAEVSEVDEFNAAIGGNNGGGTGTLTINGGTIRVLGGNRAAGIGSGWGGKSGKLTINGGTVTAAGGQSGAGIGQGDTDRSSYVITINSGTVTASGGYQGAGIGGGLMSWGGSLTINGGTVNASGNQAAGIGGGYNGSGGNITINSGKVTASGGVYSAGIGGGFNTKNGMITINGGSVTATGGSQGSGLGYGYYSSGLRVVINDGTVTATGGSSGAGIGGPFNIDAASLKMMAGSSKDDSAEQTPDQYSKNPQRYVLIDHVDTYYEVEHRFQKTDGEYVLLEVETRYSFPDLMTRAAARIYPGFAAQSFEQKKVAGDNSTVIVIYYNRNIYTIEFDRNGHGTETAPLKDLYGAPVCMPALPTDPIYKFGGWYKDKECTEEYIFTTMPLNGIKVYAKWNPTVEITWMDEGKVLRKDRTVIGTIPEYGEKPVKKGYIFTGWTPELEIAEKDAAYTATFYRTIEGYHVVYFDSQGGTSVRSAIVEDGKTVSEPAAPVREGYIFEGWYEDESLTEVFDFSTAIVEDKVLYAKWTEKVKPKYTVTWKTDTGEMIDKTLVTEGEMPVHAEAEREGYVFIGWNPALSPVSADITYTAKFIEKAKDQAAVKFNTNGGTFIDTQIVIKGQPAVKPSDPEKTGYIFEGWYADENFGTVFDFTKSIFADTIVYAKWKEKAKPQYTVTWKMDTGEVIDETKVTEGDMPVHADAEKEGYVFIGWKPVLSPVKADVTYTAKFIEKTKEIAAVKFDTNGGTFIDIQVVVKGQTAARPEDPVKSGYVFEGWYADESLCTAFDFTKAIYEDTVVYAKWKQESGKTYTILWKDYDGKELAKTTVAEGGLPDYPNEKPVRSGYIFTGWDKKITLAVSDAVYTAVYAKQTIGGGGGSSVILGKQTGPTFSPNWYSDKWGVWRIRNSAGDTVVNAWLCDDVIKANGKNVWYLLTQDGAMIAEGLVQDNTGNYYSLETEHNGYFGMLRYQDGYYNCGGQMVYLSFNREHNGAFGAVTNADGLEKLKAIYGVKRYEIGNENAVYTAAF